MPAEWAAHERCWMAWPCRHSLWGDRMEAAQAAYGAVAKAIAAFEPVVMLARPEHAVQASVLCGPEVRVLPMPIGDSWLRDTGPTFLVGAEGIGGIAWRFNGWGGKYPDDGDAMVAAGVLDHLGLPVWRAPLVLEGGAIHVDGEGTLLTTEECLLNPNRNPGWSREDMERALGAWLGVRRVIWLPWGLSEDETDGHVDNVACFAAPGHVLAAVAEDAEDPDHQRLRENLERLSNATDAAGRALRVTPVAQPRRLPANGRRLAMSYLNFYVANGAVIVPIFEDENDPAALRAIAAAFPGRAVVPVDGREIVHGGGNVHCITQQQPRPLRDQARD